jgi:hypothetical protein
LISRMGMVCCAVLKKANHCGLITRPD